MSKTHGPSSPYTAQELYRLWQNAEEREMAARLALSRIADRARRIIDGQVGLTTSYSQASYDLDVAREILDSPKT